MGIDATNTRQCSMKCIESSVLVWDRIGRPKDLIPYSSWEHNILYDPARGIIVDPTIAQFSKTQPMLLSIEDNGKFGWTYKDFEPLDASDISQGLEWANDLINQKR